MIHILIAIGLTAQAYGADLGTPQEQKACGSDIRRLCSPEIESKDMGSVLACIQRSKPKFSQACRDALKARGL